MLLPQHHYWRCLCLLPKALAQQQALPPLLSGHAGQAFHLEGMEPMADGNVDPTQMLLTGGRGYRLITSHKSGSLPAALLPNSTVKQCSSPPSARPSSVCSSLKLWLTAVPCPAFTGSMRHTTSQERPNSNYIIFYWKHSIFACTIFQMYIFQNW